MHYMTYTHIYTTSTPMFDNYITSLSTYVEGNLVGRGGNTLSHPIKNDKKLFKRHLILKNLQTTTINNDGTTDGTTLKIFHIKLLSRNNYSVITS